MLSILFRRAEQAVSGLAVEQPSCFVDLNLDQLVATLTAGRKDYNLEPFLYSLLRDVDDVSYRHEVFQDLEQEFLFDSVKSFATAMHSMRQHLLYAEKLDYRYEKMRWQLEAIDEYCGALQALSRNLEQAQIRSRALSRMRDYVRDCVGSVSFLSQQAEAAKLKEELAGIRYCLLVDGLTVRVRRYEAEKDHASEVEKTFAKFRHDAQQSYLAEFQHSRNLNHVEAMALDCVARVFPGAFLRLADFCERNREFPDPTIVNFDREVQLYLSYLELTSMLRRAGLPFCYPRLCMVDGESFSSCTYDLALASKLVQEDRPVVCNDFHLAAEERVIVVTGPNQGGKTTFARAFGQLHFLAALGFPVPGTEARLPLVDGVFAHFGKEEVVAELRGKLEDDLFRIHAVLNQCTSRSVIIMNEIFTSTTIQDALFLSSNILDRIFQRGSRAVLVTFLDEMAEPGRRTVSMVAAVKPDDPTVRTFKVLRARADGLAYALTLAARHRLTYEAIRERVRK
jgi:DNA mismatch repair protein MutS